MALADWIDRRGCVRSDAGRSTIGISGMRSPKSRYLAWIDEQRDEWRNKTRSDDPDASPWPMLSLLVILSRIGMPHFDRNVCQLACDRRLISEGGINHAA